MPNDRAGRRRSVRRAALFNEINHGLGIQWNVTAASNYRWRGHEKYIRGPLGNNGTLFKGRERLRLSCRATMERWASGDRVLDTATV